MITLPRKVLQWLAISTSLVMFYGIFFLLTSPASASTQFITTWDTGPSATITIPTSTHSSYNYFVDWGDGTTDAGQTGDVTHTYAQPGTYTVSISGEFPRIYFAGSNEAHKIQTIDNWGSNVWESMADAFRGCVNLQVTASDAPNLSNVDSLSGMFGYATNFDSSIGHWNIGNVKSLTKMFEGARSFNQDISSWDTSSVRTFTRMFFRASSFNQNINNWDTSDARSTNGMFAFASDYNQPLGNWDMSRNIDIRDMFANATSFNQDISAWDTSAVLRMESVFRNAVQFNRDISGWDYTAITHAGYLFNGSRMTGENYDQLLFKLADSNVQDNVVIDAGISSYCFAGAARQKLIDLYGWTIIDNGQDTDSCGDTDIQFTEGLAATIDENEAAGSVVGELVTIHPNQGGPYTYSFCSAAQNDEQFFTINGDQIFSNVVFDFEDAVDANADNVYELCIVSTDTSTGFSIERTVTAAVVDLLDDEQSSSNNNGNVLSNNTDQPNNVEQEVLAETDESGGSVLAATGIAITTVIAVGLGIVFITSYSHKKSTYTHKNNRG